MASACAFRSGPVWHATSVSLVGGDRFVRASATAAFKIRVLGVSGASAKRVSLVTVHVNATADGWALCVILSALAAWQRRATIRECAPTQDVFATTTPHKDFGTGHTAMSVNEGTVDSRAR